MQRLLRTERGFTLVEMMIVLFVISTVAVLMIPNYSTIMGKVNSQICKMEVQRLDDLYHTYLLEGDRSHSDALFIEFMNERGAKLCRVEGEYTFVDGHVEFSGKINEDVEIEEEEEQEDSVPFL